MKPAYNKRMDRKLHTPRNPYLLIGGVSGYILLSAYVNLYPPDSLLRIALFLIVIAASTGLVLQYLFRRTQQSILLSFGVVIFLTLRFFDLRNPLYTVLLLACIVSLELTMRKR